MNLSIVARKKIKNISKTPGVYVFYGKNKNILYVGKATNLKNRVSSYFRGGESERLIGTAINQVVNIKTIETESVLEALILESNLIKKYQPKYNVKEKDDKSFSYFVITKEEWPRVVILRKTELDVIASEDANDSSQRSAAIPLQQSAKQNIKTGVLKNGIATVVPSNSGLPRNDKIIISKVFGPYTSKKQMEIALKIVRKIFPFHSAKQKTEKGCLDFQIGTCPGPYAGAITKKEYRQNIRGIQMILAGKKKGLVRKLEKEMKELAKKHAFEKAGEARNKIFALKHIRDVALISEDKNPSLTLPFTKGENRISPFSKGGLRGIFRIEAYDISNISGQYAVGSMVVFKNGEPDKTQYRKFKIKSVEGSDDVGMMREVLYRRFNNDWRRPDLILLDGGQGHLNMGAEVLRKLELKIPLAAVAKGKMRKGTELRITNYELSDEIKSILSNKNSIKRIMDEAHRFAIGYHRKLRGRSSLR